MRRDLQFSVLVSVYKKEKPQNLIQCFDSLLQQSLPADEWVVVEDGPLTEGLYRVLDLYEKQYPKLIKRVKIPNHVGLGAALAEGIREFDEKGIKELTKLLQLNGRLRGY